MDKMWLCGVRREESDSDREALRGRFGEKGEEWKRGLFPDRRRFP